MELIHDNFVAILSTGVAIEVNIQPYLLLAILAQWWRGLQGMRVVF